MKKGVAMILCLVLLFCLLPTGAFAASTYTIHVNNGTAMVGGQEVTSAEAGQTVTLIADEPQPGYEFAYWQVTSNAASVADKNSATTTFTMPTTNVIITANFRQSLTILSSVTMTSDLPADLYVGDVLPTAVSVRFNTQTQPAEMKLTVGGNNARWTKYDSNQQAYVPVSNGTKVVEGGKYRYEAFLGMSTLNAAYYQKTYGDSVALTVDGKQWGANYSNYLGKGSTDPLIWVYSPVYTATVKEDNRTVISEIKATSDIAKIPFSNEAMLTAEMTVTKGSPASYAELRSGWQKNGEGQILQAPMKFETADYHYLAIFTIDGSAKDTHRFTQNTIVKIDGIAWTIKRIEDDSCTLYVQSPKYTLGNTAAPSYTITFDSNGGSTVAPVTGIKYRMLASAPADPVKDGYVFDGWYTDNNTFHKKFDFLNDRIFANITLYAKWKRGQTDNVISSVTYHIAEPVAGAESAAGTVHATSKYSISIGWSTTKDGSGLNDFNSKKFEAGKTYYADIYLMTEDPYIFADGTTVNINGKEYAAGWTVGADYKKYISVYDIPFTVPSPTYTISFHANGGTGNMSAVSGVSGDYTLPQNSFTAPEGKQFKAWSVGGKEIAPGSKITVKMDTVLTAVWENLPAQETITPETKPEPTAAEPTPGQEIDPTPGQEIDPSSGEEKTPGEDGKEDPKPDWLTYAVIGGAGLLLILCIIFLLTKRKKK